MGKYDSNRFSTAPMLDWSDRHCRSFWRRMTKKAVLYTEMITTGAIIHGKQDFLYENDGGYPVALQLGGCVPEDLAKCAKMGEERGYTEINLNCGCPSDRVQNGGFGASLMLDAQLVARCVAAMKESVNSVPVTVKCRIGVDNHDSYDFLCDFIETVKNAGCDHFIVHARKAWLSGLSPRDNRTIPPLMYDTVYRIKKDYPELYISINGGIENIPSAVEHLSHVDGVMVGRAAYQNSYNVLTRVDRDIFGDETSVIPERDEILEWLIEYAEKQVAAGEKLSSITRHVLDLYNGLPGAKAYRRVLSVEGPKKGADSSVIKRAFEEMKKAASDQEKRDAEYRAMGAK